MESRRLWDALELVLNERDPVEVQSIDGESIGLGLVSVDPIVFSAQCTSAGLEGKLKRDDFVFLWRSVSEREAGRRAWDTGLTCHRTAGRKWFRRRWPGRTRVREWRQLLRHELLVVQCSITSWQHEYGTEVFFDDQRRFQQIREYWLLICGLRRVEPYRMGGRLR